VLKSLIYLADQNQGWAGKVVYGLIPIQREREVQNGCRCACGSRSREKQGFEKV
jgi:hypothetical protein